MIRRQILALLILLAPAIFASHGAWPQAPARWVVLAGDLLLPDPHATPGDVAITDLKRLCSTKWGKDARHVTPAMKRHVCAAYGAKECPGPKWEVDHLISRELGGADTVKNVWAQPWKQARVKDRLENRLHKEVCAGARLLQDTQWRIARDWTELYREVFGHDPSEDVKP